MQRICADARRGCEVVHCARPVDNTARLDLDTVAVKPSVPPRRPRQQNDAALHEAVRAHWREVVRRARPVDDTARLGLDVDNTARLDPDTGAVEPSVPPRRPGQQNDAALHEAVRAHWREVVRRARPVDNTARLDLDVDNTARLDPEIHRSTHDCAEARTRLFPHLRCPLSLRFRRGGRDSRTMLHCTKRCGRAGAAVTWFAAHDRLTALHDFGGGPLGLRFRRGGRDSRTMLHCTKL